VDIVPGLRGVDVEWLVGDVFFCFNHECIQAGPAYDSY
jgi:hypothetical protein